MNLIQLHGRAFELSNWKVEDWINSSIVSLSYGNKVDISQSFNRVNIKFNNLL